MIALDDINSRLWAVMLNCTKKKLFIDIYWVKSFTILNGNVLFK